MTSVILFRAQPFHNGHLNMIKQAYKDARENNSDLYIFIGSADKAFTERNPIPIEYREDLIIYSLIDEYKCKDLSHIHIVKLNDLSDETDNTYEWGEYLYNNMYKYTRDKDMTIYYSDNPEIILSWYEKCPLKIKFVDRIDNISATQVREAIKNKDREAVKNMVPKAVFDNLSILERFIKYE